MTLFNIIIFIILLAITYGLYKIIKSNIDNHTTLQETSLSTPLEEFKESHAASSLIKKNGSSIKNVTKAYEEMCVLNPLKYKDHPELPKIISEYKKILKGIIPDYDGKFIPSEYLLKEFNQDYYTYLKNQSKHNPSLIPEKKRVQKMLKIKEIKKNMFIALIDKNIPPLIADAALNSEIKINSFSATDWENFAKAINDYTQLTDRFTLIDFVELFDSKDILFNKEKFEIFLSLKKNNIPLDLILLIMEDTISIENAKKALLLMQKYNYSLKDAIKKVKQENNKKIEEEKLRKKYKSIGVKI